eukprot:6666762-Lingulodinium_polyedra.AAC.1
MYGFRPISEKYGHTRMRKFWRAVCMNSALPNHLNLTCDGRHVHHLCEGATLHRERRLQKGTG